MLSATFDTNIIIRILMAKPGTIAAKVATALEDGDFELVLSKALVDEIRSTLVSPHLRAKHRRSVEEVEQFIHELTSSSTLTPGKLLLAIPELTDRDPDDNKVLAAAIEGKAGFVVTQDEDLLHVIEHRGVRMVELSEFYHVLRGMVSPQ